MQNHKKVRISLRISQNISLNEIINNFKVLKNNFTHFDDIKVIIYTYSLEVKENEISLEIMHQILIELDDINDISVNTNN